MDDQHSYTFLDSLKHLSKEKKIILDFSLIQAALIYCIKYHNGQFRKSGEPYYIHPIEVASIVSSYKLDSEIIVVALLHDTIEDCNVNRLWEFMFGKNIYNMIQALTKLDSSIKKYKLTSALVYKKLFSLENDNVILVKLCDRLHNLRTIHYKSIDSQIRISVETLDIFVPLAERLNYKEISEELKSISNSIIMKNSKVG